LTLKCFLSSDKDSAYAARTDYISTAAKAASTVCSKITIKLSASVVMNLACLLLKIGRHSYLILTMTLAK